jgi:hypothetical protein
MRCGGSVGMRGAYFPEHDYQNPTTGVESLVHLG